MPSKSNNPLAAFAPTRKLHSRPTKEASQSSLKKTRSVPSKDFSNNVQDNIYGEIHNSNGSGEKCFKTPVKCVEILPVRTRSLTYSKSTDPILIPSYNLNLDDSNLVLGITSRSSLKNDSLAVEHYKCKSINTRSETAKGKKMMLVILIE
ncbi:hypothetical protein RclHR1_18950003 [Rhizophagus clarus]|uniref:Uncharacterized protein n=1 Tax=Rhizophagus clarus TaxID=94130 RepID=A0A2Z6R1W1_9GLOM|nr:hypothetical protein RclHR1_18950003 [Rhizophagus clarus]